jgi:hypothetical protein
MGLRPGLREAMLIAELCVRVVLACYCLRSPGRFVYIYRSMDEERGGVVGETRAMFDDD